MAERTCSFCGKPSSKVFRLITSDGCAICNECVGSAANMIAEEFRKISREIQLPPKDGGPA